MLYPPVTSIEAPFTKELRSDAKKTITSAISIKYYGLVVDRIVLY